MSTVGWPPPDGTLVVTDILRILHGGDSYSLIAVDLLNPGGIPNDALGDFVPLPHIPAGWLELGILPLP